MLAAALMTTSSIAVRLAGSTAAAGGCTTTTAATWLALQQQQQLAARRTGCRRGRRGMVTLHGSTALRSRKSRSGRETTTALFSERTHALIGDEKPADPMAIDDAQIQEAADRLADWWTKRKTGVLCLTGAGISTESGIPDYRGSFGSYYAGHQPMRHDEFISKHSNRQRYWGRGMVGWRYFDERQPAAGHVALAELERSGHLVVTFQDRPEFYAEPDDFLLTSGHRSISLITQNVDTLHRRAKTRHLVELHGRTDQLECQNCGATRDRRSFHEELEVLNAEWLQTQRRAQSALRADGDASLATSDFSSVQVPHCHRCQTGFYKPAVVFFGDSVPQHRVRICEAAVAQASGLLVVGSSLAVHSAFRHVRAAAAKQLEILVLNVGPTRAEVEKLPGLLKLEAPAGPVLQRVAQLLVGDESEVRTDVAVDEVVTQQGTS